MYISDGYLAFISSMFLLAFISKNLSKYFKKKEKEWDEEEEARELANKHPKDF